MSAWAMNYTCWANALNPVFPRKSAVSLFVHIPKNISPKVGGFFAPDLMTVS